MKPLQTVIVLFCIMAGLLNVMAIYTLFDKEGDGFPLWTYTKENHFGGEDTVSFNLQFYTFNEYFNPNFEESQDLDDVFAGQEHVKRDDSADIKAALRSAEQARLDSINQAHKLIQFPPDNPHALDAFFEKLADLQRGKGGTVRILHYGDSQLEGDRMTSLIRSELQKKFGGTGPGLTPPVPLVNSFSIKQSNSESFQRYTMYGKRDPLIEHKAYGPLFAFGRFAPPLTDTTRVDTAVYTGWLKFEPSSRAYAGVRSYSRFRLFAGNTSQKVHVKISVDCEVVLEDSLMPGVMLKEFDVEFDPTPAEITVIMSGMDSPDVYAASLEGDGGILADNISMRGASGLFFGSSHRALLQSSLDALSPDLILLQFGGNTVPYIKGVDAAERYGDNLGRQITLLKKLVPDVPIIVMGPSDMGVKNKDRWVTHPQLENVRNALRRGSFEAGAAFYDIYHNMGGRNIMDKWVNAEPPLAAKDYIHFTPAGAKKVAEWFVERLLMEYDRYRKSGG